MRASIQIVFQLVAGLTKRALDRDEMRYSACMYRILVVAEAAKHLPKSLRERYPGINWKELIGMGDMLRHQYFRIESDVVWMTVNDDFPVLFQTVEQMLAEETTEAGS